ncbi:MAG: FadR family transcriptional regulator [Spirochaetia bacterium]|nr:FadR family transcriptional regulator [Spirochaetia bacterium]
MSKKTQSDQIVDILKEYIASDKIRVGDKLPPELSLAKMLDVSRSTVREAIRTLAVQGYIKIINGKGSFLLQKRIDMPMKQIAAWFEDHKMELGDFIEVRKLIEPYAITMAIERGTPEEFKRIDAIRLEYEEEWELGASPKLGDVDARFHQAIVDMAHNLILTNLYKVIVEAFADYRQRSFAVQYHADNAIEPHRKITTAILTRNTADAQRYMTEHLNKVYTDMSFS